MVNYRIPLQVDAARYGNVAKWSEIFLKGIKFDAEKIKNVRYFERGRGYGSLQLFEELYWYALLISERSTIMVVLSGSDLCYLWNMNRAYD